MNICVMDYFFWNLTVSWYVCVYLIYLENTIWEDRVVTGRMRAHKSKRSSVIWDALPTVNISISAQKTAPAAGPRLLCVWSLEVKGARGDPVSEHKWWSMWNLFWSLWCRRVPVIPVVASVRVRVVLVSARWAEFIHQRTQTLLLFGIKVRLNVYNLRENSNWLVWTNDQTFCRQIRKEVSLFYSLMKMVIASKLTKGLTLLLMNWRVILTWFIHHKCVCERFQTELFWFWREMWT